MSGIAISFIIIWFVSYEKTSIRLLSAFLVGITWPISLPVVLFFYYFRFQVCAEHQMSSDKYHPPENSFSRKVLAHQYERRLYSFRTGMNYLQYDEN